MIRRPPISTRTDTLFPYTTLFRSVGVHEDDALSLELLVDLVVYDLGLVLRGHAGHEPLTLGLRDAEALVRVADVFGKLFPRPRLLLGRAHEVLDVLEVDLAEVGAPRRHGLALEQLEALQTGLQHPFGFGLERDRKSTRLNSSH